MNNYKQSQKAYDNQHPDWYYDITDGEGYCVPECCYSTPEDKCRNIYIDDEEAEHKCTIGVSLPWKKQTCKRRNQ